MNEHQLILKILSNTHAMLSQSGAIDNDKFFLLSQRFVEFVEEFADDYHHGKEEDILFEALSVPGVLTHCNPVNQMMSEHDMARAALGRMKEGIDKQARAEFMRGFNEYYQIMQQHIFKEDKILYPMAEQNIGDAEKRQIVFAYEKFESEKGRDLLWEKYRQLARDLLNATQLPSELSLESH